MSENQPVWINWARTLQQWGMNKGAASLLEQAGSLCVLFAQLVYLSQPLLSGIVSWRSMEALARALEDPADRQKLVSVLRDGIVHEPAA
jgi:hypothetical protein